MRMPRPCSVALVAVAVIACGSSRPSLLGSSDSDVQQPKSLRKGEAELPTLLSWRREPFAGTAWFASRSALAGEEHL